MRGFWTAATLGLSLLSLNTARAQNAVSLEAGFLTAFEDAAFLVGFRSTAAKQGAVGVDFAIGTLPQLFGEGLLILPNLDITTAAPVGPNAWLLPRGGVSALVGIGQGAAAVPGFNVGIGLLGRVSAHTGVRLDVSYQRYFSEGESLGLTALTFGIAWVK